MALTTFTPGSRILTVAELNRHARDLLERSFPLLWVAGEISNLTRAASGHWYFSLKDDAAQVRCVMFRGRNASLDWLPREGDHVEARALVTLYEARGDYQLQIEFLQRAGLGALFEAFERLKAKLQAEGLFDAASKQPLPGHPRQIGIVTSPDAAALRDVLTTLRRRAPAIPLVIYPTPVQGKGAAERIAAAVRTAGSRAECDVLIVCRGGGSLEDLWSYNEEAVARAIAECPIPVVSGVGHETDFTIADFAADVRAATPTAAAELVSPDRSALLHKLAQLRQRLQQHMLGRLGQRAQQVDYLGRRLASPLQQLRQKQGHLLQLALRQRQTALAQQEQRNLRLQQLAHRHALQLPDIAVHAQRIGTLRQRLQVSAGQQLQWQRHRLGQLLQSLEHLSPQRVLERGYSLVETAQGDIVRDSAELAPGQDLRLTFANGKAGARVTDLE